MNAVARVIGATTSLAAFKEHRPADVRVDLGSAPQTFPDNNRSAARSKKVMVRFFNNLPDNILLRQLSDTTL